MQVELLKCYTHLGLYILGGKLQRNMVTLQLE